MLMYIIIILNVIIIGIIIMCLMRMNKKEKYIVGPCIVNPLAEGCPRKVQGIDNL